MALFSAHSPASALPFPHPQVTFMSSSCAGTIVPLCERGCCPHWPRHLCWSCWQKTSGSLALSPRLEAGREGAWIGCASFCTVTGDLLAVSHPVLSDVRKRGSSPFLQNRELRVREVGSPAQSHTVGGECGPGHSKAPLLCNTQAGFPLPDPPDMRMTQVWLLRKVTPAPGFWGR